MNLNWVLVEVSHVKRSKSIGLQADSLSSLGEKKTGFFRAQIYVVALSSSDQEKKN